MRSIEDAVNQFAYHPGTPETAVRHDGVRQAAIALTSKTWDLIPDGPEKTLALRGVQQFVMYANLAIALTVPADHETPQVARVLPS